MLIDIYKCDARYDLSKEQLLKFGLADGIFCHFVASFIAVSQPGALVPALIIEVAPQGTVGTSRPSVQVTPCHFI
jgi:hypothetical protein